MDRERRDQIEVGMHNMGDSWVHKALRDCLDYIDFLEQERREKREIAKAAVKAIEHQEVEHGRYGERLRQVLIKTGYLDEED